MRSGLEDSIAFRPAAWADFEALLALRIATMRESLERIGRFDPERARARFRQGFHPEHTRLIDFNGACIGCVTLREESPNLAWLEHFYIYPSFQGRGLGAAVLRLITGEADAGGHTLRLSVLKESRAAEFYRRHGFHETHVEDWDVFFERPPQRTS